MYLLWPGSACKFQCLNGSFVCLCLLKYYKALTTQEAFEMIPRFLQTADMLLKKNYLLCVFSKYFLQDQKKNNLVKMEYLYSTLKLFNIYEQLWESR